MRDASTLRVYDVGSNDCPLASFATYVAQPDGRVENSVGAMDVEDATLSIATAGAKACVQTMGTAPAITNKTILLSERRALLSEAEALRRIAVELGRQEGRQRKKTTTKPLLTSLLDIPDMLPPAERPVGKVGTMHADLGAGKRKKIANSQYFNETFKNSGSGARG
jgi:hypothetical protein|mmetsp:Transcript_8974/g.27834  ORF Transcript_8974/g.27834 Transcript_8974/m.27834 type:complete len:166 (-) Transcript_8974:804-1301(-)